VGFANFSSWLSLTMILLISASFVAEITDMCHQAQPPEQSLFLATNDYK
jgi:hypothetical protein